MTGWQLRRAAAADAAAVALVANATFLETYAGMLPAADIVAHCAVKNSVEAYAVWAEDAGSVLTIAEHPRGSAPIGFSLLTLPDLPISLEPGDRELRRIYALATTYGAGLGWALIVRAIEDARNCGATRVLLGMNKLNLRAHAFYERQGFAAIGERKFIVGNTVNDDFILARTV
ncbi:GNAT family N-acetyltransferase [Sphingomonas sp.]|jgi:ribosomal protein S18 acetylase RimI-like enzyme|uniref:GNAT family N-acetyltransferase n=1 Tax=Sphingomonas sp. TaxID=28214 RepID=UPI002EDB2D34